MSGAKTAYFNDVLGTSGNVQVAVASLSANTTYYYRAVMQVGVQDYYGEIKSFKTSAASSVTPQAGYVELPAKTTGSNLFSETLKVGGERNYSYLYDKSMYATLWAAYPMTSAQISGSASSSWDYNPNIDQNYQISVGSYTSNYGNSTYNRGHIVPNADRKNSSAMNKQLYYVTNQSPQVGNAFNGSVWSSLETDVRKLTSSVDTVYVVTGVAFRKVGGNETISYLTASSSSVHPSKLPIPNYFWKAILKVKRNASGVVTSASSVAFWFENRAYSNDSYTNYAVSVDQIEQWTGFDLFSNLPDSVEAAAEANTSWTTVQNFK